jgi:hypothetical protein
MHSPLSKVTLSPGPQNNQKTSNKNSASKITMAVEEPMIMSKSSKKEIAPGPKGAKDSYNVMILKKQEKKQSKQGRT